MRETHGAGLSLMESSYLKTLIEVARTGSLTKAAETLYITQSAVSRRVKFLEEQYGVPLLDRSGAVLTLTAAGQLVLGKARKILELERELQVKLDQLEEKKGLAFACTPAFAIVHLPEILRDFMLAQSECANLKFIPDLPGKIVAGLKNGLYELAVIEHCQCFDLSEFETAPLPGDEMVFAAAPALGLPGTEVTMDQLFAHTLYSRDEGCCSRTLLENNLRNQNRLTDEFRRIVVYDDLHFIIDALLRGQGVAFISTDLIRAHIETRRLKEYRVAGFTHQRKRTLIYNCPVSGGNLTSAFAETIQKYFDQRSSSGTTAPATPNLV